MFDVGRKASAGIVSEPGMLGLISGGSALLDFCLSVLEFPESTTLESVFFGSTCFGSTCFGSELDGSETSEPLSPVSGSDGIVAPLSPAVDGLGVLLGSFARMPDAGAAIVAAAATEAVGKTAVTLGVRISAGFRALGGSTPLNKAANTVQLDLDHSGRRELRRLGAERTGR